MKASLKTCVFVLTSPLIPPEKSGQVLQSPPDRMGRERIRKVFRDALRIEIIKGDITTIVADAIVNAANASLLGGGGVDGAIHGKGGKAILEACMVIRNKQGGCKTGEAVITTAGNLPSKYVIHTVGPVWQGGKNDEAGLLKNCYLNSLKLANEKQIGSIAFPNISTGVYGFPQKLAVEIAANAVMDFLNTAPIPTIKEISFVCFDEENYRLYLDKFSAATHL